MLKTKKDNSSWKSCDAKYHQKTFGKLSLTQTENEQSSSLENNSSSNSEIAFGNNDPTTVANVFGNQDLNQASSNSTYSNDAMSPSYYDSVLPSKTSNQKLTADDYV